jgi:hypothetical protein
MLFFSAHLQLTSVLCSNALLPGITAAGKTFVLVGPALRADSFIPFSTVSLQACRGPGSRKKIYFFLSTLLLSFGSTMLNGSKLVSFR